MTPEEITVDFILSKVNEQVKNKQFMSAHDWVNTAQKLNVLIGEEHDKLFELEQAIAQLKVEYLKQGESSASAKVKVEALGTYKSMQKQRAKIKQVEEMIRIAKLQARLKDNEYHNQ